MRDDSTDTIRLTELFFARDEEALRETARLYEPLCMHIALNILADRQDAEECVNDTWLRAWNHIPPDRPRSMAAYLGTVVRNLAINRWPSTAGVPGGTGRLQLIWTSCGRRSR